MSATPIAAVSAANRAAPAVQPTSSDSIVRPAVAVASAAGLIASIYNQSWVGGLVSSAGLVLAYSMGDRAVQTISAPPASATQSTQDNSPAAVLGRGLKVKSDAVFSGQQTAESQHRLAKTYDWVLAAVTNTPASQTPEFIANLHCMRELATNVLPGDFSEATLTQNNLAVYAQVTLSQLNQSNDYQKASGKLTILQAKFAALKTVIPVVPFEGEYTAAVQAISAKIASLRPAAPQATAPAPVSAQPTRPASATASAASAQPAQTAPAVVTLETVTMENAAQLTQNILESLNNDSITGDEAEALLTAVLDKLPGANGYPQAFIAAATAIGQAAEVKRAAAASAAAAQNAARPVAEQHTVQQMSVPVAPPAPDAPSAPTSTPDSSQAPRTLRRTQVTPRPPAPSRQPTANATRAAAGFGNIDAAAGLAALRRTNNGVSTGAAARSAQPPLPPTPARRAPAAAPSGGRVAPRPQQPRVPTATTNSSTVSPAPRASVSNTAAPTAPSAPVAPTAPSAPTPPPAPRRLPVFGAAAAAGNRASLLAEIAEFRRDRD